ncbi:hypothetical protein CKO44_17520 [Rubrivivax gelatinosus]|uniref:hypothetical protein n=1 Tax=Rubrivivax gelatinosus TaxID=28068 RepID=UPI001905379C|nr:hypothetical protein [Rubrivivax gelatinosus]MBK1615262.1 hypothetical protein [Rubrivivax gelatinosus]
MKQMAWLSSQRQELARSDASAEDRHEQTALLQMRLEVLAARFAALCRQEADGTAATSRPGSGSTSSALVAVA